MIRFIIRVYTTGFTVKVPFMNDRAILTEFNKRLQTFESRYNPRQKKIIKILKQTYAVFIPQEQMYGLHRNLFEDFMNYMKRIGIHDSNIEMIFEDVYEPAASKVILSDAVKLRDYQVPITDFVLAAEKCRILNVQTGKGKAQNFDAKIKIPGGWSTMGEMKQGMLVTAWDGIPSKVIGVYPQGLKDVYKITFEDDRSTECELEHLWKIYHGGTSSRLPREEVVTLEKIMDWLPHNDIYINLIKPENPLYYQVSTLVRNKKLFPNIPDIYFTANNSYRLQLLEENEFISYIRDLVDNFDIFKYTASYGCTDKFDNITKERIIYLVRSLGGKVIIDSDLELIKWFIPKNTLYDSKLKIKSVEYVGKKETQCIEIDHPDHLYITDDFIVTHNTLVSLYSIAKLGVRTVLTMASGHKETWIKSMAWIYTNSVEETLVISGNIALRKAIANAKAGTLDKSILLITLDTIRDYLTEYNTNGKSSYGCNPQELYKTLGVGFRITDEAHEQLHFGFRHDILTNVPKCLFLSATLDSHDKAINKLYEIIFPYKDRYQGLAYDRYIAVVAVGYRLKNPEKMDCDGPMGYSHIKFEQSILENKHTTHNYLEMISRITAKIFIKDYIRGQKYLIYCASIEMCECVASYLDNKFNNSQYNLGLNIVSFNGNTESEVLYANDILVSTRGSVGTGKDILGLVKVLSTIAIDSKQSNKQMVGRLRRIDELYPGLVPTFYYLVCLDINKHRYYHDKKLEMLKLEVVSHTTVPTTFLI